MNESIWNQYRIDDPYFHNGNDLIPGMKRYCFEMMINDRKVTLGLYEYNGTHVLKAWGYKDEEHCSYHAIKINGVWSEVIEGCPDFKVVDKGFSLTHKKLHVWTDDEYHEEALSPTCCATETDPVSLFDTVRLYLPLITTALFSFAVGGVITSFQMFSTELFLMNSMGVFITLIGLLKLRDVHKFVQMFRRYDPLAKKSLFYARFYPYLETTIGVLILSRIFVIPVQLVVIAMYTCTSIGIIHSLKSKENLACGCLGGGVTLPLSNVTIFENIVMITMALFTLLCY